ncbi:MAG: hypothetical protein JXB05_03555 [Myxococcaceae bacterium]|nr:hypothetical protein [Myxococcaceae bacterium]
MLPRRLVTSALALLVLLGGCTGASEQLRWEGAEPVEEGGGGGDSVSPRILALIARGQFAEAQVLIHESVKGGLMSQATATGLLARIQLLNTKLGEIPARLQRVASFPAVLKDYTLHQILLFLEQRDYSVATQAQLMTAKKLIEQSPRLMEKIP